MGDDQVVSEGFCVEDPTIPLNYGNDGYPLHSKYIELPNPGTLGGMGYPEYWQNQVCCKDSTRYRRVDEVFTDHVINVCATNFDIVDFDFEIKLVGTLTVPASSDCGPNNLRVYSALPRQ